MPKFAGSKLTSHDKDLIQALLNDGMPLQQIADKFDVSYSTIRRMK
jgi:IS30 family transposase